MQYSAKFWKFPLHLSWKGSTINKSTWTYIIHILCLITYNQQFTINIMAENNNNQNKLNIELPEEIAEGTYSNLAVISHSQSEFIVDFVRMVPNVPKAKVKSRVIMTPENAKRLLGALAENIKKFESQNGVIKGGNNTPPFPIGFNTTPKAQA
jgi:hypothetical protein